MANSPPLAIKAVNAFNGFNAGGRTTAFCLFIHIPNLITSAILLSTIPSKLLYSQNNKNFVR